MKKIMINDCVDYDDKNDVNNKADDDDKTLTFI